MKFQRYRTHGTLKPLLRIPLCFSLLRFIIASVIIYVISVSFTLLNSGPYVVQVFTPISLCLSLSIPNTSFMHFKCSVFVYNLIHIDISVTFSNTSFVLICKNIINITSYKKPLHQHHERKDLLERRKCATNIIANLV